MSGIKNNLINDSAENLLDPLLKLEEDNDDSDDVFTRSKSSIIKPTKFLTSSAIKKLTATAIENQKKCQKLIGRNRCLDNTSTNSNNNNNNNSNSKSLFNSTNKKRLIIFIVFIIIIFYFNSSVIQWNTTERIPVIHHSHVPGMKVELQVSKISQKEFTRILVNKTNDDSNYKIDNNINESQQIISSTIIEDVIIKEKLINNTISESTVASTNFITSSNLNELFINYNNQSSILPPLPSGYLVWSDKCKMPSIDPYDKQIMKYFERKKYEACSKEKPLTSIHFNKTSRKYELIWDEGVKNLLTTSSQLDCCYQSIKRNSKGKKADRDISYSSCLSFSKSAQIPNTTDNIIVKCKSSAKQVYVNGHPMMPERSNINDRFESWKANDTKKPISVLLVGIDSISRVNLIRAMPKTAQYLYDNEWFEMSGYNKMDDNTFPNLMAILAGFNSSTGFTKCNPRRLNALDECPMIWKLFKQYGYVTAYAEDEASISTFNYLKLGFQNPPVDYYLRPFLIAAEKSLSTKKKSGLTFCLGYQHSADYIYDYAIEFATRYKNEAYFGLFWANTFSHNDISQCSSMDVKMVEYLEKFSSRGILNDSIVIFFSDHGMRFGPTRKFLSGHLEERLPFMFIWLPQWVKDTYPEFVNGLSVNKNRLTNPYDIHMTLKDILEHSGRVSGLPQAPDCQNCQTLLKPVPHSRSCQDIAIEDHWCTCIPYSSIFKNSPIIKKLATRTVDYINDYVATYKNGSVANVCGNIHLHDIIGAYRALLIGDSYPANLEGYRIVFSTNPGNGMFEATLRYYTDTDEMEVTGSVSRLNSYASDSKCVSDGGAKKYCHCAKHASNTHTGARSKG